jgi:SAM-dependent methyltransferase
MIGEELVSPLETCAYTAAVSPEESKVDAYANYIFNTASELVRRHELVMGRYYYQTLFSGKRPILDLGPGRCWFTKQQPADIVAVDNSPALVAYYAAQGLNAILGDAYSLPFEDNHFEGAFCCWLYEHLARPDQALSELRRALKPGAQACIIVPTPNDMVAFYDDYTHVRPFTPRSLQQLGHAAGFQRQRITYLPFYKGIEIVIRYLGDEAGYQYNRLSDTAIRSLGLINRNQLMLQCWK